MGVRILHDKENDLAAIYDSVTDTAFGRVFYGDNAADIAEEFLQWLPEDALSYGNSEIGNLADDFIFSHTCECGEITAERKDGERAECASCAHERKSKLLAARGSKRKLAGLRGGK